MNAQFDPAAVVASIEALIAENPALKDDDELRADMVEGCTDAFDAVARLFAESQEAALLAEALDLRIKQMRERKARLSAREDVLRAVILKIMQAAELKKVPLPEATLSVRAGTPKAVVVDEADLPDEFMRIKREVDKKALLDALKAGRAILGASLSNGEPSLSVRVA